MKRILRAIGLVLILCMLFAMVGCSGNQKKVIIASKQFTENILLSEMYSQLVEANTDLKVERKQNLGGTSVCFPAMEKAEIDIYVEYSGTAYAEILKLSNDGTVTSDGVYDAVQSKLASDYHITMFEPIGINNTYALGMLHSVSEELDISSMSDLTSLSPNLRFGANHVFYTRELDGYDAMMARYGYNFSASEKMDSSLLYEAIAQKQLDVIIIYATDSLLVKYDMTILKDDLSLFPAYHGAPICRNATLETYPELNDVLNKLAGFIDDSTMQQLDYQVDVEHKTVEAVAKQFLTEQGLVK